MTPDYGGAWTGVLLPRCPCAPKAGDLNLLGTPTPVKIALDLTAGHWHWQAARTFSCLHHTCQDLQSQGLEPLGLCPGFGARLPVVLLSRAGVYPSMPGATCTPLSRA